MHSAVKLIYITHKFSISSVHQFLTHCCTLRIPKGTEGKQKKKHLLFVKILKTTYYSFNCLFIFEDDHLSWLCE